MASTVVAIDGLPAGLAGMTLELYANGSDTLANDGGADALTEETNRDGYYTATVTEALTGKHYALIHLSGGAKIADGYVYLADDTSTYRVVDDDPLGLIVEANGKVTAQEVLSVLLAACAGVTADSGATLKDPDGTATRIAATVDSSNNRTAITLTPSS